LDNSAPQPNISSEAADDFLEGSAKMEGGAACLGLKGASNIFRESDDEADLAGGLDLVVVGAPPKISSSAVFEEFPTSAKISSKAAVACAAGFLAGAFLGSAFVSLLGSSFLAACSFFGSSFFYFCFLCTFFRFGFCLFASRICRSAEYIINIC